jgi:hypothetical protein
MGLQVEVRAMFGRIDSTELLGKLKHSQLVAVRTTLFCVCDISELVQVARIAEMASAPPRQ